MLTRIQPFKRILTRNFSSDALYNSLLSVKNIKDQDLKARIKRDTLNFENIDFLHTHIELGQLPISVIKNRNPGFFFELNESEKGRFA